MTKSRTHPKWLFVDVDYQIDYKLILFINCLGHTGVLFRIEKVSRATNDMAKKLYVSRETNSRWTKINHFCSDHHDTKTDWIRLMPK